MLVPVAWWNQARLGFQKSKCKSFPISASEAEWPLLLMQFPAWCQRYLNEKSDLCSVFLTCRYLVSIWSLGLCEYLKYDLDLRFFSFFFFCLPVFPEDNWDTNRISLSLIHIWCKTQQWEKKWKKKNFGMLRMKSSKCCSIFIIIILRGSNLLLWFPSLHPYLYHFIHIYKKKYIIITFLFWKKQPFFTNDKIRVTASLTSIANVPADLKLPCLSMTATSRQVVRVWRSCGGDARNVGECVGGKRWVICGIERRMERDTRYRSRRRRRRKSGGRKAGRGGGKA